MIIAMAGLPGTGKSTLASALAEALPGVVLNKDAIRAALFPPNEIEYSHRQDDFVFGIMLQVAEHYLQKFPNKHVILDGRTFSKKPQVDILMDYCQMYNRSIVFIKCVCSDETARSRIENDLVNNNHLAANRNVTLYQQTKDNADTLLVPHLTVDTGQALEACVHACLDYIGFTNEIVKESNE